MAGSVVPRAGGRGSELATEARAGTRGGEMGGIPSGEGFGRGEGGALFHPSFSSRVSRFPLPALRILRLSLRSFLPALLWPFLAPATRHLVKCQ